MDRRGERANKWQGPALRARSGALNIRESEKLENLQTDKQTEISKTEATLILCGSSGERANYGY